MSMDKQKAIQLAGSPSKLAKLLGIKRQSVYNWDEIPPLRIYQLRVLRPHWFDVIQ